MKLATIALTLALALTPVMASAHEDMKDMKMDAPQSESSKAFNDATMKMHEKMSGAMSGNADVDFAKGMLPHHEGAVDMAKIELQYGKDPELRKLAQEIVKAQEAEIVFLKSWIEKNAK